ncbi:hypothetical protein B0H13DRAFT_1885435 [Mycena leptocephala]|nr:hypothetical protein B0H13DRAFT_1885435 [Mycena leptocephala]
MANIERKSRRQRLLDPNKTRRTDWHNASTCGGTIGNKFGEHGTYCQVNKKRNENISTLIHPCPHEDGEEARFEQARAKESRAARTNTSHFACSRECPVHLCAGGERRENEKAYAENSYPVLPRESLDAGWCLILLARRKNNESRIASTEEWISTRHGVSKIVESHWKHQKDRIRPIADEDDVVKAGSKSGRIKSSNTATLLFFPATTTPNPLELRQARPYLALLTEHYCSGSATLSLTPRNFIHHGA